MRVTWISWPALSSFIIKVIKNNTEKTLKIDLQAQQKYQAVCLRQPPPGPDWREAAWPSAAAAHLQQKPTDAVTKLNLLQQLI